MSDVFIKIEDLCFSYEDDENCSIPAVKNISLEIKTGSYVAILGHNGSGKSTLAKLLNMILTPLKGKIFIGGKEISNSAMTEDDIFGIRRNIGMVFQNPDNQLVATIVEEDVAFGPENLGIPPEEIRMRVDDALRTVGMTEYARHAPHKLSGGQKQRVAIAGIIAMMPKCIVFDESTAMLDPVGRKEVLRTIEQLNQDFGLTVLNITHHMDEAVRADRVIVINDGEVYMDGTPAEVFSQYDKLREAGLDAPQTVELLYLLSKEGYDFEDGCLTVKECVDAIAAKIDG